jgi:1-acyl-sn-glycerol-3-phosphate acyltransferase
VKPLDLVRIPARVGASAATSAFLAAALTLETRMRGMPEERREAYVRAWARILTRALGVEVVREGDVPRIDKPNLVVSNHRSTIDIFLMLSHFGGHLLARGDMEQWPVIGKMAQMAGTLFVDRADANSGAASIRRVTDRLQKGRTIGVFAEGTTFDDDVVRPFHAGAFMAIARVRGAVTPVGLAYEDPGAYYKDEPVGDHFKRVLAMNRIRVGVAVGDPIDSAGIPIGKLRDRTHEEVQRLVHRARVLVAG